MEAKLLCKIENIVTFFTIWQDKRNQINLFCNECECET